MSVNTFIMNGHQLFIRKGRYNILLNMPMILKTPESINKITAIVLLVIALVACKPLVIGNPPPYELVNITILTTDGGRVDWSPDGQTIAFDRLGSDGKWDLWLMDATGENQECITCDRPELGYGDMGQPAFHPSGEWLAFQREAPDHRDNWLPTHPGAGVYNDLMILRLYDREVFMLNDVADGTNGKNGGTLHSVFSHSGDQILWTDYERGCMTCPVGDWQIALADFVIENGLPSLTNRQNFNPGQEGLWYETHGFGLDDSWIYFSAASEGQNFLTSDIVRMDFANTSEYIRLTETGGKSLDETWAYDEHAHLAPDGDAMIWLNDESSVSEFWMMRPDRSGRMQVTFFNTEGHPHNDLVDGKYSVPSDNAWNKSAPEGTASALGFIQVDFDLLGNSAPLNYIVRLDFERTQD